MHNLDLNALHIAHRLYRCNAIWNHKKGIKQIPNPAKCAKLVLGNLSKTVLHKHYNSYTGYQYMKGFITKYSHSHISASMDKHQNT